MEARERYAAIDVRDLRKVVRVPHNQANTLKERALHPFRRAQFDERRALDGVSFQVAKGEFFGIVGRNGSGKSTLLKCLAGIYQSDGGKIKVAGRLAPFIELGVGFNPELTARENALINAVMMGLTPTQARERFDEIIAFAELEEFLDVKLKNYSSGMQVRLAFSVMVQLRRRRAADRRGAGGRRRRLPAEVLRRLRAPARRGPHDHPRDPRHVAGRALLRPRAAPGAGPGGARRRARAGRRGATSS